MDARHGEVGGKVGQEASPRRSRGLLKCRTSFQPPASPPARVAMNLTSFSLFGENTLRLQRSVAGSVPDCSSVLFIHNRLVFPYDSHQFHTVSTLSWVQQPSLEN